MLPTSPSPTSHGFRALLGNRPFMALWIGQVLSQVADKVFFVLLIALLTKYQMGVTSVNSLRSALMIAYTLPAILFGSAAGIFVDRIDKKQVLTGSNLLRGVLILAIPFLPKLFPVLLVIAFLESTLTQFFAPAEQAAIPLLVRPEGLMTANALFTTTMMGSLIVGFAIGEPLLQLASKWGAIGPEILVGGLYLLAGIVLYLVPLVESHHIKREQLAVHPWKDFKAGLKYLAKDRLVSNAMLQLMILYSVFAALTVLAIGLAEEIGLEPTKFGFLLAAAGVGMVFGAGILGHWGSRFRHRPLPLIGFISMAFVLGVFTFTDNIWLGLCLSGLLGIGAALVGVPMQTLIQQQTPESMRGKVFGFQNNVVNIALSLPLAIAGPLTDAIGLRWVLLSMSMIVTAVGVWAWQNTRRVLENVL
ncbi:MFS transporter [Leptolyngbya sp. 'hensonii']|uniref:MFS transporter n=1 Tax=Leptolyngbya sp. 'hensonii' TaxID=1922337 RepID=UPI00094F6701|nr:MFS transporter [Leptolyngbya sp. 'hensonii']OLP16943.1 MFS transporter [Leptolyngbya sp. 'hensonii']